MEKKIKYLIGIALLTLIVATLALYFVPDKKTINVGQINNFEECVAAGYPVMESYPEQCLANGITFTNEENAQKKYVTRDTEQCKLVKFMCEEGRRPFFDDSGCGCEKIILNE